MKKLILTACTVHLLTAATAQVPNARMAKPDTGKNNNLTAPSNARLSSIPGLKSVSRGMELNNKNQIVVLGFDPSQTHFTDDPKFPKMISDIMQNMVPVDRKFTPLQSCTDLNNCIYYNSGFTDIQPNYQRWVFKNDEFHLASESIMFITRLQPSKDYLVIIEANIVSTSQPLTLNVSGHINKSQNHGHFFPTTLGKNQFTFVVHTNADYQFKGLGPSCTCFTLSFGIQKEPGLPNPEFRAELYSIRIKELNL